MTSSAKRLRTALRHLTLAAVCAVMAGVTLILVVQTATRISVYWDQLIAGRPVHISVITSGITLVLMFIGGCLAARWALAFLVVFLAATTKSGTALNLRLARAALRLAPRIARTTLVTAAGASMVLTAGPALASQDGPTPQAGADQSNTAIYLGFDSAPRPVITSPSAPSTAVPAPAPAPAPAPEPTASPETATASESDSASTETPTITTSAVVVATGDSLWSITAQLNPGATNAQLSELWPQLYEANKQTIGSNPDLIVPGTELLIPASLSR